MSKAPKQDPQDVDVQAMARDLAAEMDQNPGDHPRLMGASPNRVGGKAEFLANLTKFLGILKAVWPIIAPLILTDKPQLQAGMVGGKGGVPAFDLALVSRLMKALPDLYERVMSIYDDIKDVIGGSDAEPAA